MIMPSPTSMTEVQLVPCDVEGGQVLATEIRKFLISRVKTVSLTCFFLLMHVISPTVDIPVTLARKL